MKIKDFRIAKINRDDEMKFLPTLNEFINENTKKEKHKSLIDDFCEFPEEEKLFILRSQAIQRIDDIVMFHRFVMVTHDNNQQVIKPEFEAFNKHYKNMFDNINDDNEAIVTHRQTFQTFDIYEQQSQIKCIANESLIINLWATIEQYTNHCIKYLLEDNFEGSHRWFDVVKKFKEQDKDITSLDSYNVINEIRVLNNKIKHLYHVDNGLAKFDYFKEHNGKKINKVPLRVEYYTIGSYHFLCQLISHIGPSVRYTDDIDESS